MADRTHIPSSPACGEWETLLVDAIDGLLRPEDEARFLEHKAACPDCAALYEDARKGRAWLEFLSPEPEVPAGLFDKILAKTGPGPSAGLWNAPAPALAGPGVVPDFVSPVWQQPGFLARMRAAAQPRMFMTAAMAFFSIAFTLNITGVRFSALHVSDLRPRAMRSYMERQLTMASVPIVRYYDHLRIVYEVESRVRELRGDNENVDQPRRLLPSGKPGESRSNPLAEPGNSDPHEAPENPARVQPLDPASDLVRTSLEPENRTTLSHGSALQGWERSNKWIA